MRLIWRTLLGFLALLGLLTLLLAGTIVALGARLAEQVRPASLPERMVLTLDLGRPIAEVRRAGDVLDLAGRARPTLTELVLALDRAAADPRVLGLVATLAETSHGLAVAQELRGAVARLRAAGKFALVHADSFGELGPANEAYYLASAFEEISLQPVGLVGLAPLVVEQPFAAPLLARLGIDLEVIRRSEYKTALDNVALAEISPAGREMLEAVLADVGRQLDAGIAAGRRLPPAEVGRLRAGGTLAAEAALAAGLIDRIEHRDQLLARVEETSDAAPQVTLAAYARRPAEPAEPAATIAVIGAEGAILRGADGVSLGIGTDDLVGQLGDAADDPLVGAVVLRLTSPGGSAVASETIARAVARTMARGKPVIVSMGNVAASGGYWIAMGASRIVAQPGTLTGSIGVVAGKPVLAGLWAQLGVRWAEVAAEAGAGNPWSVHRPFSAAERARIEALVDGVYAAFKDGVARGRKLTPAQVEAVARGRVWTGEAALGLGLVDRAGGVHEAVAEARDLLGLPPEAAIAVVAWPERRWPSLDEIGRALEDLGAGAAAALRLVRAVLAPGAAGPGLAEMAPPAVR